MSSHGIITAHKRSYGKVIFVHLSVIQSMWGRGSALPRIHHWSHDQGDLPIGSWGSASRGRGNGSPPGSGPFPTDLLNLDLIVQGPKPALDMFNLDLTVQRPPPPPTTPFPTCSNLFTIKHGLPASGLLASLYEFCIGLPPQNINDMKGTYIQQMFSAILMLFSSESCSLKAPSVLNFMRT